MQHFFHIIHIIFDFYFTFYESDEKNTSALVACFFFRSTIFKLRLWEPISNDNSNDDEDDDHPRPVFEQKIGWEADDELGREEEEEGEEEEEEEEEVEEEAEEEGNTSVVLILYLRRKKEKRRKKKKSKKNKQPKMKEKKKIKELKEQTALRL